VCWQRRYFQPHRTNERERLSTPPTVLLTWRSTSSSLPGVASLSSWKPLFVQGEFDKQTCKISTGLFSLTLGYIPDVLPCPCFFLSARFSLV
jgi:hypothetical protein